MRKETTKVIERNGGMHRQRAYRRIRAMVEDHDFTSPRLYHLVLVSDLEIKGADPFLKVIKALCRKLRDSGIRSRWRGALEQDEEKGLHFHVFLMVENKVVNPCAIINTTRGKFLQSLMERHAMRFHLSKPKADMHRVGGTIEGKRNNYASLAGDKLPDCLEWMSYLVKARSKPKHIRNIYFGSRDSGPTSASIAA